MNILIFLPTNIGDTAIGFPVIDRLHANYPDARITVLSSPRNDSLVRRHLFVDDVIIYDKKWPPAKKIEFVLHQMGHYDMMADLKNSFLPFLLGVSRHTPFIRKMVDDVPADQQYLSFIDKLAPVYDFRRGDIVLSDSERARWDNSGIEKGSIFVACASRSILKQYDADCFRKVIQMLSEKHKIVLVGEKLDADYYSKVSDINGVINLCGKTEVFELFYLLGNYAGVLLSVDTGVLHIASYVNVPIVALFGPTIEHSHGPWSSCKKVLRADNVACAPCMRPHCTHNLECMKIDPQSVVIACEEMLSGKA